MSADSATATAQRPRMWWSALMQIRYTHLDAGEQCGCIADRGSRHGLAVMTFLYPDEARRLVVQGHRGTSVPGMPSRCGLHGRAPGASSTSSGAAEKVVMDPHHARDDSFDLVCLATGVLMHNGGFDPDDAFDELLGLAIRRGERLEVTAYTVVTSAEIGRALVRGD